MHFLAWLAVSAVLFGLTSHDALACSLVSTGPEYDGLLRENSEATGGALVVRNIAVLTRRVATNEALTFTAVADGKEFPLRLARSWTDYGSFGLYVLDAPLPARTRFESPFGEFETSDAIVEATPPAPQLSATRLEHSDDGGCENSGSSCGEITTLHYEVAEVPRSAFYGIYIGDSRDAVARATTPSQIATTRFVFVDEAFSTGDHFVAITTFDVAGHESPKSAALRIANDGEGCSTAPSSSGAFQGYVLVLVAAALSRAYERARRPSQSRVTAGRLHGRPPLRRSYGRGACGAADGARR